MFIFLSKLLPPFVYPLGLACFLIILALLLYRRIGWQRAALVLALLLLWSGSNRWTAFLITRPLEWRYLPPAELPTAEAIVVLGGGTTARVSPRRLPEVGDAGDRVIYGVWLFQQGAAPHILLSGGRIDWLNPQVSSGASEMADLMVLMGIPRAALWLQPESRNTYEDALYCRKILEAKGIHRIILVTSAMHMPRSVALFEHQGLQVIPYPADFGVTETDWQIMSEPNLVTQMYNLLPSADNLSTVTRALKEYLGLLVYRLRGWI